MTGSDGTVPGWGTPDGPGRPVPPVGQPPLRLAPVRVRGGRAELWTEVRAALSPRAVAIAALGVGVVAVPGLLHLPHARLVTWAAGAAFAWAARTFAVRRLRRDRSREVPPVRVPESTDPSEVAAPQPAEPVREQRALRGAVTGLLVLAAGLAVGGGCLVYAGPGLGFSGWERALVAVSAVGLPAGLLVRARTLSRTSARLGVLDVGTLVACQVTVLGVIRDGVPVVVPGAVSPGEALRALARRNGRGPLADRGRDFGGPVFCAEHAGDGLGTLVAGDVLVCHGTLEEGGTVRLANRRGRSWILRLGVPLRFEVFDESGGGTGTGPTP